VAPISVLLEYMIPFLKVHGRCVLWKSKHIADELRMSTSATKELRAKLIESYTYDLPGDWGQRTLLVFEKVAPTPNEYPREVGVPKHKPLGAPEEV
jgi:16S rRNA (guanine527-N7)-methyltransferase